MPYEPKKQVETDKLLSNLDQRSFVSDLPSLPESIGTVGSDDPLGGLGNELQVHPGRKMLDVPEVQFHPFIIFFSITSFVCRVFFLLDRLSESPTL
jgi:hypothetical protein